MKLGPLQFGFWGPNADLGAFLRFKIYSDGIVLGVWRFFVAIVLNESLHSHTQNLRDNVHDRKRFLFRRRGWLKDWFFRRHPVDWEVGIYRWPEFRFRCSMCLGGEDTREISFSFGAVFWTLHLAFHNVLPEKWEVGWYMRGEEKNPRWDIDSHGREFGFYVAEKAVCLMWNRTVIASGQDPKCGKQLYFWLPWDWGSNVRHEYLCEGGRFAPAELVDNPPYGYKRKFFFEPYTYVRKNGEVQKVQATFYVEEREWRWRMFHWLPFAFGPKKVSRGIWVNFSSEVGEGTGSWKGGALGCGYELLPGENPVACLRRMERERKFT